MRVEAFSVKRTYSSSPSLRWAFSIAFVSLFHRRLCQSERCPIRVDQAKFVCPSFAMVNHLGVTFLFDEGGDVLDRAPAGDMPVLPIAENTIEQTGRTEQSHMTAVQGRNRPAGGYVVPRQEQWGYLPPGS